MLLNERNDDAKEKMKETPIEALNLSARSYNALKKLNINTVSELSSFSYDDLKIIRNLGEKSVREIIEKVSNFKLTGDTEESYAVDEEENLVAPEYEVADGRILNKNSGEFVEDVWVDELGFSVRLTNALWKANITCLSQIISLTKKEIRSYGNIGCKSYRELIETVPRYLDEHKKSNLTEKDSEIQTMPLVVPIQEHKINRNIAPEYSVHNQIIYNTLTNHIISDGMIEKLGLSVRARNGLIKSGYRKISDLILLEFDDLNDIRNLGIGSVNEIQEKLNAYLNKMEKESEEYVQADRSVSGYQVLEVFNGHEFETFTEDRIKENLPDANEDDILYYLDKFVNNGNIIKTSGGYEYYKQSFFEYIQQRQTSKHKNLLDEKTQQIILLRASGMTLEEIGELKDVTRERIRQIESKGLHKAFSYENHIFKEDAYKYLFCHYSFEKEFYQDFLHLTKETIYYLNNRYKVENKLRKAQDLALEDEQIPIRIRRQIDKYIHRNYILIDGEYIPDQRSAVEDLVLEKYCKDEVAVEDFFDLYTRFIAEHGLSIDKFGLGGINEYTRYNRLSLSKKVLWKQNRRLRYYDIEDRDFTELIEAINLEQYDNVEISTKKLLLDFPDLMRNYDIRDEYELHNLLKKIHAEQRDDTLVFGRMPTLKFGEFNRDKAVREVLFELAPVAQDEFAEILCERYGYGVDTIKANWLDCIDEYYYNGMYSVDYEEMPEEHRKMLQSLLTEDFYYISHIKRIYKKAIDNADDSLISTYNLKKMGFIVGSKYAIKNFTSAEAYFKHILTQEDVFDVKEKSKKYGVLPTYYSVLNELRHDRIIIEFEPYQYINIRRLEKMGYGADVLSKYGDRVFDYICDEKFFTVIHLKNRGFNDELDNLGFGDWFYSSLLKEDERFSWQKVGNNIVFSAHEQAFMAKDFLKDYVKRVGSIDVDEFSCILKSEYGVFLEASQLIEKMKNTDIYYDPIMRKFYKDYSTYFEEI